MAVNAREAADGGPPSVGAQLEQLQELISRHAGAPDRGVFATAIDGVFISSVTEQAEAVAPTSGTILGVIAQGGKRMAVGERVYEYNAGQYLIATLDLPVRGSFWRASEAEPALGVALVLEASTIASLLLDAAQHGSTAPPRSSASGGAPPALGVAEASAELLDAIVRLLRLLDAPADRDVLAPMIKREILWRLLAGPVAETVRQAGLADSSLTYIGQAVRRITEHYSDSFRVEDLARSSGMSTSAFHRNFQAVTGFSPIQFQKQIRLQRSRLMLIAGVEDVATVGYHVGYDSASQFSREYRRQFGLPPGRDAEQLRAGAH